MNERAPLSVLPALAGIAAVLSLGLVVAVTQDFGPFSAHMAAHIAAMNVAAPLAAIVLARHVRLFAASATPAFWLVAGLQILALWAWHLPIVQSAAMHSVPGELAMHGSLFVLAVTFWTLVLQIRGGARWQVTLALVITGKLSCLLAALFIFSPRFLYASPHHEMAVAMTDQQLAGLLMITACPLSYVAAALIVALEMSGVLPASPNARTA